VGIVTTGFADGVAGIGAFEQSNGGLDGDLAVARYLAN
jgi:hypothetical protein